MGLCPMLIFLRLLQVLGQFTVDVEKMLLDKQFFFNKLDNFFNFGASDGPYNFLTVTIHMKLLKCFIFDCKRNEVKPNGNDFVMNFNMR